MGKKLADRFGKLVVMGLDGEPMGTLMELDDEMSVLPKSVVARKDFDIEEDAGVEAYGGGMGLFAIEVKDIKRNKNGKLTAKYPKDIVEASDDSSTMIDAGFS